MRYVPDAGSKQEAAPGCHLATKPPEVVGIVLYAAMTAPSRPRRLQDYGVFVGFLAFWCVTLLAPRSWNDAIVFDCAICLALAIFLGVWIAVWGEHTHALLGRVAGVRGGVATPVTPGR